MVHPARLARLFAADLLLVVAGVAGFLSDPKRPIESTLRAMMTTRHLGETGPHPVVASAARELLNKSENERSGVLSTAMSFLGLYRDPVVAKVKPVKLTVELPATVFRDLAAYADAIGRVSGQTMPAPAKLIVAMVHRFMATDREFAKVQRAKEPHSLPARPSAAISG